MHESSTSSQEAPAANWLTIAGLLIERKALRYTPAGVPVSEGTLEHVSQVMEGGLPRRVEVQIALLALGSAATWLDAASLGMEMEVAGFLAPKSRQSRQLVLHVNTLRLREGKQNG